MKKHKNFVLACFVLLTACSMTRFHLEQVQTNESATLTAIAEGETATIEAEKAQTENALATSETSVTIAALTPSPNPLLPLGYCGAVNPPCQYIVEPNDFDARIAENIYGSRLKNKAGLIANLFRDERGYIEQFIPNSVVIVPKADIEVTLEYMQFYMNELFAFDYGLCTRGDRSTYSFPCFYISNGESIGSVSSEFYASYTQFTDKIKLDALQMANRVAYDPTIEGLVVIAPGVGDILIIPALPP